MSSLSNDENSTAKKTAQKTYFIWLIVFFGIFLLSMILFSIAHSVFLDEIIELNKKYYATFSVLVFLPVLFSALTLLIYIVPFFKYPSNKKRNDIKYNDFQTIINGWLKPTTKKEILRKRFFRSFLIKAILTLLISQIYLYIGIFYLFYL
ncbi:MAG: hypothetical protein FK730_15830 [Asgard group archaeon]|nr:hypothetical protein [Asgard group archaeon]